MSLREGKLHEVHSEDSFKELNIILSQKRKKEKENKKERKSLQGLAQIYKAASVAFSTPLTFVLFIIETASEGYRSHQLLEHRQLCLRAHESFHS